MTLAYNEALDEDSVPAPGDYTVTVDGSRVNVTAVAVDGSAVDLTLAAAVATTQTVTVSYRVGANPVRDLADHDALGLTDQEVSHDNTPPEFVHAYVNGATLTVVFNEDLDENQEPAASSFTRSIGGTTAAATAIDVTGKAVTLTFAAVTAGQTVTVKYDQPTASPLRDLAGNEAASIAFQSVNNVTGDTTMPALSTQVVDGTELTLTYGETLDEFSTPAASAFAVEVDGSTASLAPADPVEIESGGQAAKLTLAAAVTGGQTVKVSYTKPSTNPLRDLAGNDASGLNEVGVDVHGITGVEFTNQPTGDYATIGGHVEVTVTFSEAATVSGTPRIELSPAFGPGEETRHADYVSGSGTTELVFRYTLVDGDDSSTTNVSVPADGLDPDGSAGAASIKFGTEDAPAGHVSVSSGKLVSVDRPTVSLAYASVAPTVDADLDGRVETYAQGNGIKVKVRFSEALTVSNAGTGGVNVQVVITIGSTDHTLNYLGVSGNDLEFGTRTVAAADADTNGITVKRDGSNKLVRLSGTATVKDTDGGNGADLTGTADLGVRADHNQATPLARVRGTNAAPTGADFTKTTGRDRDVTFARSDFAITDGDGDPLKEIQVVSLPTSTQGTLKLDGTAITTTLKTVSRAQLGWGQLVFDPAAAFHGDATFTFKVVDSFGAASASSYTATITVLPGPPLLTAVANGRTLALVYEDALDEDSVPATGDFTVKVDGSEVNVNAARVAGSTVTLTLARSVSRTNVVTLSYTAGANPIQDEDGNDAVDLADQAVDTTPPVVRRAVISRDGRTMTVQLNKENLKGSFVRTAWTYRADRRGWRYPTGGSFDAANGIVTLTFSTPVTWTETLLLRYRQVGSVSSRLRNQADHRLAGFSDRGGDPARAGQRGLHHGPRPGPAHTRRPLRRPGPMTPPPLPPPTRPLTSTTTLRRTTRRLRTG